MIGYPRFKFIFKIYFDQFFIVIASMYIATFVIGGKKCFIAFKYRFGPKYVGNFMCVCEYYRVQQT